MYSILKKPSLCLFLSLSIFTVILSGNALAKDGIVNLSKDSIIQITLIDMKHGEKEKFFNEYLEKIEPILESHGGSLEAKFETFSVVEGNITPQYVLLLEWPSLTAFDKAASDRRVNPYKPVKKATLRTAHFGLFTLKEDVSFSLEKEVAYEFFTGDFSSLDAPAFIEKFFQKVIPTALDYGRKQILELSPVNYENSNYGRAITGVAIWPTASHFYQFTNTTVFREGIHKFGNPAMSDMEIINAYVVPD